MLAVFINNSKQYIVKIGSFIILNKTNLVEGQILIIKNILIYYCDKIIIGNPFIYNAYIIGKVKTSFNNCKNIILKKKRRNNYKKKITYRNKFVLLEIKSINIK